MRTSTVVLVLAAMASPAVAQHEHHPPPSPAPTASPSPAPEHQPPSGPGDAMDHHDHMPMTGMLGPYPMHREGSGTSWVPESSPMEGIHFTAGAWMLMLHGFAHVAFDHQSGPRGDEKVFAPNMQMLMAQRPLGAGTLGVRLMTSLDPATVGASGYPLLLQTGEAVDGQPLIDRQHPHDLFMELAAVYSHPVGGDATAFLYAGLPGEPALGPSIFMHRFSGMEIPEAPITHHWMDSTHIAYGVLTGGITTDRVKVDASAFRGREPDEHRWDIESPKLDSYSFRVTFNPSPAWSLQASAGHLKSPEELEPEVDLWRTTASVTYHRVRDNGAWQTTLAWGRNDRTDQDPQGALFLETTLTSGRHIVFGRGEIVSKDELFADEPRAHEVFDVARLSLGYLFEVARPRHVSCAVGGLVSFVGLPSELETSYGGRPVSFVLFARTALR